MAMENDGEWTVGMDGSVGGVGKGGERGRPRLTFLPFFGSG